MKVVLWFLMMLMPLLASASSVNEEQLFHRLDSYIAQRSKFTQRKEAKLLRLKKQLHMNLYYKLILRQSIRLKKS